MHPDYGNRVLSISTWPYCKIMKGSHWILRLVMHGREMSFSPENPELPAPGDHRPSLPRLRRAPIPRRRDFLRTPLPRHRQKPSIRDDDRAGSAVGERGEVRSSVRYAPLLANVEPVAVLEEEATCYTQFGDPEIEIPMADALKSLYPPGTRLLEADSGSRRTRIVDTSDVTDDAFASFAAQRGDNAQDDAPTEDVMVGRSAPSAPDYDAIHRERLHRVLMDERRRALLMWQREQFVQRAAVVRAQALAPRHTAVDLQVNACEVRNPTIAPATVPDPLLMPDPSTRAYMIPSWLVVFILLALDTIDFLFFFYY
eukprot:s7054_g1.t1